MRSKFFTAVIVLSVFFMSGCSEGDIKSEKLIDDNPKTFASSIKSFELYSWQVKDNWRFVVVEGSNRIKSANEITSNSYAVDGVEQLLSELRKIPKGAQILWNPVNTEPFSFPASKALNQIQKYCSQRNINLEIINWK